MKLPAVKSFVRFFVWASFCLFTTVLVLAIALPWWLGFALKWSLPEELIRFERYERVSYTRFALHNVEVETDSVRVVIDRIEMPALIPWFYSAWSEDKSPGYVDLNTAKIESLEKAKVPDEEKVGSNFPDNLPDLLDLVNTHLKSVNQWLPYLRAEKVVYIQGKHEAVFTHLLWEQNELKSTVLDTSLWKNPADLNLKIEAGNQTLDFSIPEDNFSVITTIRAVPRQNALETSVNLNLDGNQLSANSVFDQSGWIPVSASWSAHQWNLVLSDYGLDLKFYDRLSLDLEGFWKASDLKNIARGIIYANPHNADKSLDSGRYPDIEFNLRFEGNRERIKVDALHLEAPGLTADLAERVEVDLVNKKLLGDLNFVFFTDLSAWKWQNLEGLVNGSINMNPDNLGNPKGRIALEGNNIFFRNHKLTKLSVSADVEWPEISVRQFICEFGDHSSLRGAASFNPVARILHEGELSGTVDSVFLDPWINRLQMDSGDVDVNISATGAFHGIAHTGELRTRQLIYGPLKPLDIALNWSGMQETVDQMQITLAADSANLSSSAQINRDADRLSFHFDHLVIESIDKNVTSAAARDGFTIIFPLQKGRPLEIDGLMLEERIPVSAKSDLMSVNLTGAFGNESIDFMTVAENFDSATWIDPWLEKPVPGFLIKRINIEGSLENRLLNAKGSLLGNFSIQGRQVELDGSITLGERKIQMENFTLRENDQDWFTASGVLPYSLQPFDSELITAFPDDPLSLHLSTKQGSAVTGLLSPLLPTPLESFSAEISLEGSLIEPRGKFEVTLKTQSSEQDNGLPAVSVFSFGEIEGPTINLSVLKLSVFDKLFIAQGVVELPSGAMQLIQGKTRSDTVDWLSTHFEIEIPDSSLVPLTVFMPDVLRPEGNLSADLKGNFSTGVNGSVSLRNINTRAIFPFGSARNIEALLNFDQSIAEVKSCTAMIGREWVSLTGNVNYNKPTDPVFQFYITGQSLPLVRQSGLLLRSDLNLSISNRNNDSQTQIAGNIKLKDGLFMKDLSLLNESGGNAGSKAIQRPPWFSVAVPPFSDWELNVSISGQNFIRLQTPAATGMLSMDMMLEGTLESPRLRGWVEFDKGNILFPFATYQINHGLIELRADDPYTPVLEILADTRRFGYDLSLDISGNAYDPVVRFGSSPPLSSDEILVMIMAGENPEGMQDYSNTKRVSRIGTYLTRGLFSSGSGNEGGWGSRFSMSTGANLSKQGKETIEMELIMTDQLQIVGEYDEYDAWNAGIRWRFFQDSQADVINREKEPVSPQDKEAVENAGDDGGERVAGDE